MDEVDAALDNVNVKKVCSYIKSRSRDFQCIVISLKDIFYEQSDSLVGICRDVATDSSQTLTLDLTQFDWALTGRRNFAVSDLKHMHLQKAAELEREQKMELAGRWSRLLLNTK